MSCYLFFLKLFVLVYRFVVVIVLACFGFHGLFNEDSDDCVLAKDTKPVLEILVLGVFDLYFQVEHLFFEVKRQKHSVVDDVGLVLKTVLYQPALEVDHFVVLLVLSPEAHSF